MSRWLTVLALTPTVMVLAACGGSAPSSRPSVSSSTPLTSSTSPALSTTNPSGTIQSSSPSVTSPPNPARPPEVPASRQPSSSTGTATPTNPTGPDTHVRVPATFTIRAGGALEPPSVSVPALFAVALTAISGDGHAHIVLLRTPRSYSLRVPARGRASILIPGLHAGQYVIDVDGAPRGALSIGGQPGP
jgi:hypothetical protein